MVCRSCGIGSWSGGLSSRTLFSLGGLGEDRVVCRLSLAWVREARPAAIHLGEAGLSRVLRSGLGTFAAASDVDQSEAGQHQEVRRRRRNLRKHGNAAERAQWVRNG